MEKKRLFTPAAIALLTISAGMCVWFVLPGFFNAGTFLGVTLCVLAAGCVLLRFRLGGLIKKLWRRIPGRIALCVLATGLAGFVGFCGYNFTKMAEYADRPLPEVKCVMILGCQVKWKDPGNEMLNRLSVALPLIQQNPGVPVVVSGGQGRGEYITEADCMKRWLIENGVEEQRIYTECESHSTATNFSNSAPIFQRLGISDGIAVVTNDFHQYRANIYANRLGLSTGHYSAQTRLLVLPNYLIREAAALFFV